MDICEIVIDEVRKSECLYNLASKDYKNVHKKNEIWEKIGSSLNLSGDTCKKRWRGLRDTYKRHKRAAQLASGSGAPSPTKKWKYMESLRFLDNYKDSRPTIGSVVEEQMIDLDCLFDCSSSTVVTESRSTTNTDESNDSNEARQKKNIKKKADAEVTSVFKDVMKECVDTVKELASVQNDKNRDATTLLFESLALKISEAHLPQVVVRRIESKVMTLVYDELAQSGVEEP